MKPCAHILFQLVIYAVMSLFLYAAVSKIIDSENFRIQLGQSPLVTMYAQHLVWFIPGVELVIALLLCLPKTQLPALYASFALMCTFTFYIIAILNFSYYIPCSCGGILQNMGWKQHLSFNILTCLSIAGTIYMAENKMNNPKIFSAQESGHAENL